MAGMSCWTPRRTCPRRASTLAAGTRLRDHILVQGVRLPHGHRLARGAPRDARPPGAALVRGRHHRPGLRGASATHAGGRRDRVRGRHHRLPGHARHQHRPAVHRSVGIEVIGERVRASPTGCCAGCGAATPGWRATHPALRTEHDRGTGRHDPLQRPRPDGRPSTSGVSRRAADRRHLAPDRLLLQSGRERDSPGHHGGGHGAGVRAAVAADLEEIAR